MAEKKYSYSKGRRKTSSASVRVYLSAGKSTINEKEVAVLYPHLNEQKKLMKPFLIAELEQANVSFTAKVVGGGANSQLEATVLAISRAIIKSLPDKKKALKDAGLLTRDPRMVERKKPGLRKARKAEQYSKR